MTVDKSREIKEPERVLSMSFVKDITEKKMLEEYEKNAEKLGITLQEYLLLKIAIWCEDNK